MKERTMFVAGSIVRGGYYFNRDRLDLIAVGGKEGTLPGDEGQRYFPVPAWAAVALAPLFGGLFVVIIPLIGLARVLQRSGRLVLSLVQRAGRRMPIIVPSKWRRGEAASVGREEVKAGEDAAASQGSGQDTAPDPQPGKMSR